MEESYGFLSVLPPVLAIILAIRTKQVYVSLLFGIWLGWLIIANYNPLEGSLQTVEALVAVFDDPGNTRTIMFCALVGALIVFIQRTGGVLGFIHWVEARVQQYESSNTVQGRVLVQLFAWLTGILVFVESSISVLTVGTLFRPIFDKMKISREKLAYIADSSSAPTCILIPFNAWGAFIMGLLAAQGFSDPFATLFKSIIYNYYPIFALLFVALIIWLQRDFGPMKKAEKRVKGGKLLREGAQPLMDEDIVEMEPLEGVKHKARNMIIPVSVMTGFMPVALYITGEGNITQGSGSTAVFWSVMLSIFVAALMYRLQKLMSVKDIMDVILKGAGGMISLAILMMLAFSLGATCKQLGTGQYVATLTSEFLHVGLVPFLVFAVSGFVAFSTGTSFGTFALMIPLAVPFVETLGVHLPLVVSAVLGGGVFGDHCSPISDTTLVSSMATASDHIDHVRTQLPYAMTAAGIAGGFYLIAGFVL